jgi:hypothetical protein
MCKESCNIVRSCALLEQVLCMHRAKEAWGIGEQRVHVRIAAKV